MKCFFGVQISEGLHYFMTYEFDYDNEIHEKSHNNLSGCNKVAKKLPSGHQALDYLGVVVKELTLFLESKS